MAIVAVMVPVRKGPARSARLNNAHPQHPARALHPARKVPDRARNHAVTALLAKAVAIGAAAVATVVVRALTVRKAAHPVAALLPRLRLEKKTRTGPADRAARNRLCR